ncbi:DUF998 domain-containing protein [Fodinicola feengrottensis]|uniref:DUF998 domain-containing protein n=1 Tax=Fodinicola feengrottensis TaxID=435914 RepID=UPI0013D1E0A0|nr:DUF998 domain-containing protein [Fodinicola feengrottensis]
MPGSVRVRAMAALVAVVMAAGLVGSAQVAAGFGNHYLSELAVGPRSGYYTAGVFVAAVAVLLLWAVFVRAGRAWWMAGGALAVAGVALLGSASVPCTAGCPLPVADGLVSVQDTIHASVSNFAWWWH